jgi:hypothetical protein
MATLLHADIAAAWQYTSEVKVTPRHHMRNDYMSQQTKIEIEFKFVMNENKFANILIKSKNCISDFFFSLVTYSCMIPFPSFYKKIFSDQKHVL